MSTTLAQAAAAGVRAFSTDPVVRAGLERLSPLVQAWFTGQGCVVQEVSFHRDFLLNGNQGAQFVFMDVRSPTGLPVRVACEFLAHAAGESLLARLRVRAAAGNGWVLLDSANAELRYGDHPGVYKMELLSQRLLTLLSLEESGASLKGTPVATMLRSVMDEVETSALA